MWGQRRLGASLATARSRLLDLGGYYRPMASVRDGVVILFDAMNPVLDAGWPALSTSVESYTQTLRPNLEKKPHGRK